MNSRRCVFLFDFTRLLHPDLFHPTQEHTILSSRVRAHQRRFATEARTRDAAHNLARLNTQALLIVDPRILHAYIAPPIYVHAQDIRAQSGLHSDGALACPIQEYVVNVTRHRAGVLATALATAEHQAALNTVSISDMAPSARAQETLQHQRQWLDAQLR